MEGDKHFSHDHPLISFFEENYDDVTEYACHICGLPILSSPSFTCPSKTCNFFLHKPCSEFPENLSNHPVHDFSPFEDHNLPIYNTVLFEDHNLRLRNSTYKCRKCDFHIHPLEIQPAEIKTMHKSHPPHPLVAVRRETLCRCDACADEHRGFFFCCRDCNFWIHRDCTLLPSFVQIRSEFTYILTYSLNSDILRRMSHPTCLICFERKRLLQYDGIYFCGEIEEYAHVRCAKPYLKALDTETASRKIIQLPDEGDIFPSLLIRKFAETNPDFSVTQHDYNKGCHKHDLILHNNDDDNNNSSSSREGLICDVCTQPVDSSSPFFRCKLQPHCNFLVHIICANLPSYIKKPWSEEPCYDRTSNGFEFDLYDVEHLEDHNLECRLTPATIKHASHPGHVLFRVPGTGRETHQQFQLSCCSSYVPVSARIYRCIACDYYIHNRCALLPKRTRHKSDEHPLELITATTARRLECCFCEFCEEDIDQRYWYYGCRKCEHYFHVDCIPSVGRLSRAKLGKTLDDADIHRHPVAVTRMLTIGRHERCGYCDRRIKGFEEEIAFHCSECDFWIHFGCVRQRVDFMLLYKKWVMEKIG